MTVLDTVLEHAARRDPMHDAPMLVRFNPDVVAQASAELARLRALLVEARDALRAGEWDVMDENEDRFCVRCGHYRDFGGHSPTCALAALLARIDAEVGRG